MRSRNKIRRCIALVLTLALTLTLGGVPAFAANADSGRSTLSGSGMMQSPESMINNASGSDNSMNFAIAAKKVTKPGKISKFSCSLYSSGSNSRRYKLTWSAAKNATGYQVQSSFSSNFKKISANAYTTKLDSYHISYGSYVGKKYYVRVRAFRISGSKVYYGPWKKLSYRAS